MYRYRLGWALMVAAAALAASTTAALAEDAGQKAFVANKCNNCHAVEKVEIERKIESEKMAGPDLSEVGKKRQAEWIVQFMKREVDLDEKLHKSEFKGAQKDLKTIAEWLVGLTPEDAQGKG